MKILKNTKAAFENKQINYAHCRRSASTGEEHQMKYKEEISFHLRSSLQIEVN